MVMRHKLLVLDEATEGLAPVVRHEIWAAIGELNSWVVANRKFLSCLANLCSLRTILRM